MTTTNISRPPPKRNDMSFSKANQKQGPKNNKWPNSNAQQSGGPLNSRSNQIQSNSSSPSNSPLPSPGLNKSSTETIIQENDDTTQHMHDRMLFLLMNLVGLTVQVTVKSGARYEGIFHSSHTSGELAVTLKLARKLENRTDGKSNSNPVHQDLIVLGRDLLDISAVQVDLAASEKMYGEKEKETFKTDTDISGRTEIRERELQRWGDMSMDDHNMDTFGTLELDSGNGKSWDQFAVNERLFGLKSDFNEEIYTTKLDRNSPGYREKEKEAMRIASEIQRSAVNNPHVAEERGFEVDDSGMDEEDRYGAVVRPANPNAYVPPALRSKQTTAASVVIPVPSIISILPSHSSTQPSQSTQSLSPSQPSVSSTISNISVVVSTTPPPAGASSPVKPAENIASKEVKSDVKIEGRPSVNSRSSFKNLVIPPPKKNIMNPEKKGDGTPSKQINPSEIASTFRKFADTEKQKLQQRRQQLVKKDKNERIADLKKFSETFKLNSPVPSDLLPLLSRRKMSEGSKDDTKSDASPTLSDSVAISASPITAVTAKPTVAEPEKKEIPVTPTPTRTKTEEKPAEVPKVEEKSENKPSHPTTKTEEKIDKNAEKALASTTFKFNVKASEFKPNPSAQTFTPSTPNTKVPSPEMSPFFGNKPSRKGSISLKEALPSPFSKGKNTSPSSVSPNWQHNRNGNSYRHQFPTYEEEYQQSPQPYPYAAYPIPYGYPQFVPSGMRPMMPMQGAPYMNPQFVQAFTGPMSHPTPVYSPSMAPIPPQSYGGSQGFPSPGRAPMVAPGMPSHQMYPAYAQGPHGTLSPQHMLAPYHPQMIPNMPPNAMLMQRMDPNIHHYAPPDQAIEISTEQAIQQQQQQQQPQQQPQQQSQQ